MKNIITLKNIKNKGKRVQSFSLNAGTIIQRAIIFFNDSFPVNMVTNLWNFII